jgi:acetyltransferase
MIECHKLEPVASSCERADDYPAFLIDAWHARRFQLVLRPVLPHDRPALGEFIARLSPRSRHERFQDAAPQLPADALRAMSEVNYRDVLAVVVTARSAPTTEIIVADGRYVVDSGRRTARFALVVDDDWQRCGVGLRVVTMMVAAASRAGLDRLIGRVPADNAGMLALARRCGFSRSRDPEAPGSITIGKVFTGTPAPAR